MLCSRGGAHPGQVPAPLVAEHAGAALSRLLHCRQQPQGQLQEDHAPQDLGRPPDPLPRHDCGLGTSGPVQGALNKYFMSMQNCYLNLFLGAEASSPDSACAHHLTAAGQAPQPPRGHQLGRAGQADVYELPQGTNIQIKKELRKHD